MILEPPRNTSYTWIIRRNYIHVTHGRVWNVIQLWNNVIAGEILDNNNIIIHRLRFYVYIPVCMYIHISLYMVWRTYTVCRWIWCWFVCKCGYGVWPHSSINFSVVCYIACGSTGNCGNENISLPVALLAVMG